MSTYEERLKKRKALISQYIGLSSPSDDNGWDDFVNFNPGQFAAEYAEDANGIWYDSIYTEALNMGEQELARRQNLRDQWYNSEAQKNKRLKAAGINPALSGLGDASELESEMTQGTPTNRLAGFQAGFGMFSDIASLGLQALDMVNSLQTGSLQRQGMSLQNESTMFDNVLKMAGYEVTPDQILNSPSADGSIQVIPAFAKPTTPTKHPIRSYIKGAPVISRREARANERQRQMYNSIVSSPSFQSSILGKGQQFFESKGDYNAASEFFSGPEGMDLIKELYKLTVETDKAVASSKKTAAEKQQSYDETVNPVTMGNAVNAENGYKSAYYSAADGTIAGEAFNAANEASKASNSNDETKQEWIAAFMASVDDRIKYFSKKGNDKAAAFFSFLGLLARAYIEQPHSLSLPNMSFGPTNNNFIRQEF